MIEDSADVHESAEIAPGAHIWHLAQVRERARIGDGTIVGRGAYIGVDVVVGANCKVQNYALIYSPSRLGDGVFVGPGAIFANDRHPRAITPEGTLKNASDWKAEPVIVERGASIGAGAILLPGVTIGEWALVASGAVVHRDVPPHGLVAGVPARSLGWVAATGSQLVQEGNDLVDKETGTRYVERAGRLEEAE